MGHYSPLNGVNPIQFNLGKEIILFDEEEDPILLESKDEPITCPMMHKLIDFKMLSKIRQMEKEEVYTVRRLGPVSSNRAWNPLEFNTGKCTALVRFRVNRPINIESYGFYGPFDAENHGKYHIDISLLTEDGFEISETSLVTPVIKNSTIFHVNFENPVPILPCIWYMAKFSLLGPPTSQSQKLMPIGVVRCGEFENTKFDFEMPDSNQLPEIRFTLRV